MTLDQYNFLVEINLEFIKQVELHRDRVFVSPQDRMLRRFLLILIRSYAKILNNYFAPFQTTDSNFMTEEEAQLVVDRFNYLCHTDYEVPLTITDIVNPGPSSVWDDLEVWDDNAPWID